jgi:CRP/FNR family cyclic AMP-dependent transcriptional regulator
MGSAVDLKLQIVQMTNRGKYPDKVELLRANSLLAGISEPNLVRLGNASRYVNIPKGTFLFNQHDEADSLYFIYSGFIAVVLTSMDGREMIINELRPGDCFGEVSLLTTGVRTASAQARNSCVVLETAANVFLNVLDSEPTIARRMLAVASDRLSKAQLRESALAFLDAPSRIARALLEMDELDRQGPDKGYISVSQEELALRTGLARQTVANSLAQWRHRGWIVTGRGRIMLLNRAALKRTEEQI